VVCVSGSYVSEFWQGDAADENADSECYLDTSREADVPASDWHDQCFVCLGYHCLVHRERKRFKRGGLRWFACLRCRPVHVGRTRLANLTDEEVRRNMFCDGCDLFRGMAMF